MKLVLCSASPRRREFLERIGVRFSVAPAHIDETQRPGEPALSYVLRMAEEKSAAGAREGHVALGADTIVVKGEEVLGKPRDVADAERILGALSGAEHRVITAVAVSGLRAVAVETRVRFAALSQAQIRWLAASGDGDDKAGAYAAQGLAGAFIERIDGSFSNVVGLPLLETLRLLDEAGVELPWT
jgi:septum formation protein